MNDITLINLDPKDYKEKVPASDSTDNKDTTNKPIDIISLKKENVKQSPLDYMVGICKGFFGDQREVSKNVQF